MMDDEDCTHQLQSNIGRKQGGDRGRRLRRRKNGEDGEDQTAGSMDVWIGLIRNKLRKPSLGMMLVYYLRYNYTQTVCPTARRLPRGLWTEYTV